MFLKKSKIIITFTYISIFFLIGCKSSLVSKQDKAVNTYKTNIAIVENFIETGFIENESELSNSIIFLEDLTNIKSEYTDQFQMFYTPSRENLKKWKKWYKENKSKLYWDEKLNKVTKK